MPTLLFILAMLSGVVDSTVQTVRFYYEEFELARQSDEEFLAHT